MNYMIIAQAAEVAQYINGSVKLAIAGAGAVIGIGLIGMGAV